MDIQLIRQSIHDYAQVHFSRSGGPGGQNVNKVNTKVTLKIKLQDVAGLSEAEQTKLRETLHSRLSYGNEETGELVISSSEERSQRVNLERAYARAEALISAAARLSKKRRPTKPSKAAREARLKAKKRQSEKKAMRKILSFER